MRYEIDILHYIGIYRKEWKKTALLMVVVMAIAVAISFCQPTTYRSTLTALSQSESGGVGNIGKYLSMSSLNIGTSSEDIIFSILKSRRMTRDINAHFKASRGWRLDTYVVTGGFNVEVTGPDPLITKEIANFAVENLDKINLELNITAQKPMVKVLDPAERGTPAGRNMPKKAIASGLFVFLIHSLFIFFREYFYNLKTLKKRSEK